MKDIRRRPYRKAPPLIPSELIGKTIQCPHCNSEVPVPWTEKLEFPKQTIEANDKKGHFAPIDFPLLCNNDSCKHKFYARVPIVEKAGWGTLYGDEAGRHPNKSMDFFCITLVGLEGRKHEKIRSQIEKIKQSISPHRHPNDWQHHFTDIWSSSPESKVFNLKTKEEKIKHAKNFAKIIREARPELATFNISGFIRSPSDQKDRKTALKNLKEEIFRQAIVTTLKQSSENKLSVRWVFDNTSDASSGKRTEGWALECFLGLQYTRLFTWLAGGLPVVEPEFVQPGTHCLLEIADFISYCVG